MKTIKAFFVSFLLFLCAFGLALPVRAETVATIEATAMYDIYGRALSINDSNEVLVLGSLDRFSGIVHPMLWKDGVTKEISVLGSADSMVVIENPPNSLNNKSEFVGYINHSSDSTDAGFIYSGATDSVEYLNPVIEGFSSSHIYPVAINNNSQVLGYYMDASSCYKPFIWQSGIYKVINNSELGCYTTLTDINDNGYIIGYSFANGAGFGFMLDTSSNTLTKIQSDATSSIQPKSINNLNHIVGIVGYSAPFYWKDGVLSYLPTLGGSYAGAYSINDTDEIVGDSYITGDSESHGVLWENNAPIDLGTLSYDSSDTVSWGSTSLSINNGGLVVGTNFANDASGQLDTPVLYDYVLTKIKKPKKIKKNENAVSLFMQDTSKKSKEVR